MSAAVSHTVIKNFRGLRARVIHPEDDNRARLVAMLLKLGLEVTVVVPGPDAADAGDWDIVFFDADEGFGQILGAATQADVPFVALIGTEAPSRLARVVAHRAASHILKPVRSAGVYAAVFLAVNEARHRRAAAQRIETLRQRLAGRRVVMRAVVRLMQLCGIDEDAAYCWLREEAMRRRIPIEDMARESLGLDKQAHEAVQQRRISHNR